VFDTEQLTADRPGEEVLAGVGLEERGEDGKGAARIQAGDGDLSLVAWLWGNGCAYKVNGG
jgi:hypothetical protein